MKRLLNPSWQFLLASGLRRGVWMAAPGCFDSELSMACKLLERGELSNFSALEDEITIKSLSGSIPGSDDEPKDDNKCAIIPITGVMLRYGTLCSYGADEYAAMMDEVSQSDEISSVVLLVDSGGGDSRAVPPILDGIERLKSTGKPVVASVDTCASAAYFISSVCDKIFAQNTIVSAIGSIGTYGEIVDYSEAEKSAGIVRHRVYAPDSKDKNQPEEKALEGEYSLLQNEVLAPLNNAFISTVKSARPNVSQDVFTGKMYYAQEAISLGLIDGIKSLSDTVRYAQDLALTRKFTQNK